MSFSEKTDKEPIYMEDDLSDDWSNADDSSSEEEKEFKPPLDPGKITQELKNKLESVISQKFKIPVNNTAPKRDNWTAWNTDDTWNTGNPFFNIPPPPPTPPSEHTSTDQDYLDVNNLIHMISEFAKNIGNAVPVSAQTKCDYTEVVKTLEYPCFNSDNVTDVRFRAYCFAEKMYACCMQLLSRAKDAHGEKSYVSAKVESLEQQFKKEFANLLEQVNPDN